MIHAAAILLTAFILDLLLGDPVYRFHPVRLMGRYITALERVLLHLGLSGLAGGTLLVMGVVGLSVGTYITAHLVLASRLPWIATLLDVYLAFSCLALTDLLKHAVPVGRALGQNDLTKAQAALQGIVGRSTALLDPAGVARGAVESVAENFVDGVLSPFFWYSVGAILSQAAHLLEPSAIGVCSIVCFKAISTLDSMVGYRHGHYALFGRPSARLDDLVNFIPARLSLIILFITARMSGESAAGGWKVAIRDRLRHPSPNAGHPESFVAGALGIKLGGPTVYQEGKVEKPWLGDGEEEANQDHIRRSCRLIYRSSCVAVLFFTTILAGLTVAFF